jgi:hypothetical protein
MWSSNPLLGLYLKEMKLLSHQDICTPHVYCSIIHSHQDTEIRQASINRWMDKENVMYI